MDMVQPMSYPILNTPFIFMKPAKGTQKKASARKAPKAQQPITIRAEDIDAMLEEIIANAMALQMLWQSATGGREDEV